LAAENSQMPIEIAVVTIINLIAMGVSIGIFISKVNLILYRIKVLENKQDKCNQLKERLVTLETIVKSVP
jgi:hypothetical protein